MNSNDLRAMKQLMKVINDNVDGRCPNCGDKLSATIGNLQPSWSDHFDNIVCWWCATHPCETDTRINQ